MPPRAPAPLEAFLSMAPLFSSMPTESLRRIAAIARPRDYAKGQFIFHEGDPCEGFAVVQSGAVKVMRVAPDGRERVLFLAEQGQSFAEVAVFLDDGLNPATAQAAKASRVVFFPKPPFLSLLRERQEICFQMLASLAQWTKHLVRFIASVTNERAEARLAKYILGLAAGRASLAGKKPSARLPVSKQTLASYLTMSPETLSRVLRGWQDGKIVRVKARQVEILQADALRRLARGQG